MTTEYRRGIPSTAHIEAATRLGLEWHRESHREPHNNGFFTRFRYVSGQPHSNFAQYSELDGYLTPISPDERTYSYRPIRPDGTLVDWEVLDQEVVRVGQQGQPQGFRADLWRRICSWITSTYLPNIASITSINDFGIVGQTRGYSWDTLGLDTQTDEADRQALIARWTVYQELKPLYDLVDGAQGEFGRDSLGVFARSAESDVWRAGPSGSQVPLRNFAAVLDAVAERRVAERMRGQTQVPTVTSTQHTRPEPRRFADVRPDRHGWRWWRIVGAPDAGIIGARFEAMREQWRWLAMSDGAAPTGNLIGSHSWTHSGVWDARTVIPTDEQGNPVSWEAIAPVGTVVQGEQRRDAATENEVQRVTQVVASITQQALQQILGSPVTVSPTTGHVEPPTAAPSRFALIEIDDADPTAKRIRQEQEAERHRLAELRQRLAAERAAQPAEETPETTSRFDLIEPDTQADPATSIRAWEARQAAAKVRPVAAPPRIAKPAAAPRRPAIEVVDAEVDGLSRSEVFAALFGRALNGGC